MLVTSATHTPSLNPSPPVCHTLFLPPSTVLFSLTSVFFFSFCSIFSLLFQWIISLPHSLSMWNMNSVAFQVALNFWNFTVWGSIKWGYPSLPAPSLKAHSDSVIVGFCFFSWGQKYLIWNMFKECHRDPDILFMFKMIHLQPWKDRMKPLEKNWARTKNKVVIGFCLI